MGVKLIYDYDFARFHTFANRTTTTESGCTFRRGGDVVGGTWYNCQFLVPGTFHSLLSGFLGAVCVFGCSDAFPDRTWGRD